MLAHPSQVALGRAGFLVLVVSVISPAALPIANQLEQTFFQFLLVSISWAWATLARECRFCSRSSPHMPLKPRSSLSPSLSAQSQLHTRREQGTTGVRQSSRRGRRNPTSDWDTRKAKSQTWSRTTSTTASFSSLRAAPSAASSLASRADSSSGCEGTSARRPHYSDASLPSFSRSVKGVASR